MNIVNYTGGVSQLTNFKIVQGDLLELARNKEFDIIVHGCNCFNTMGSGIAKQIGDRFPQARQVDYATEYGDYNKLGNYTSWTSDAGLTIVNAYTQYTYSRNSDVFEYTSFKMILQKLAHNFPEKKSFGFPLIGMGLAGGDKNRIFDLIDEFAYNVSTNSIVTVVEYSK